MSEQKGVQELAGHIFAFDLDRPSMSVADALALKLYELGYRRIPAKLKVLSDQKIIADAVKAERERIWGELEDIRCCADGDYLSKIEYLMCNLTKEEAAPRGDGE